MGVNCPARWRALPGARRAGITRGVTNQREATRWAKQAATLIVSVQDAELRDDLRLRFDERAAICEVDGRLTRVEAERVAYDGVVAAVDRLRRGG